VGFFKTSAMTIQEKIQDSLLTARKNKSQKHIDIYRVMLGEFDRIGKNLSDEEAIKVLTKIKKGAKECFDLDTVALCNTFLPTLLNEQDIRSKVLHIINVQGIKTFPAAFGRIMGEFNKQYKGKADNKLVAQVVREILNPNDTKEEK
jgi:uncharacterized protein YqeY